MHGQDLDAMLFETPTVFVTNPLGDEHVDAVEGGEASERLTADLAAVAQQDGLPVLAIIAFFFRLACAGQGSSNFPCI